jgi:vacuolar-type H+-ATPase subunit D/Vma8
MNAQGEFEATVATITAWVTETKEKNEQLAKEVRRVTGELTHLQESVVKPMEKVLISLGLYNYQSYAECVTATAAQLDILREARRVDSEAALNNINEIMRLGVELDRVTGERDALRKLQADGAQT